MTNPVTRFVQEWRSKAPLQKFYMISGLLFLAFAVVGLFLPIVPQVPFAILAAVFFSKGSPRLHQWMRHHKHLGGPICNWEDHRAVSPRLKIISTLMMIVGAALGHWKLALPWALALDGVFLACIVFLVTRKSRPL